MDTLNEIKPGTLAITLRVSELETIIDKCVTKALSSMPLWQDDPNKQQLFIVLAELSPEQTRQVLAFAIELMASAPLQQNNSLDSEGLPTTVDTREADNEAQATIAHALSSLIGGNQANSNPVDTMIQAVSDT